MIDTVKPSDEETPVLPLVLADKASLYAAFMPFLKNGGLFVRTAEQYALGTTVILDLKLMEERTPYRVSGTVVWVAPAGGQGGKPAGIGVQLSDEQAADGTLIKKIEQYLAGSLNAQRRTDTM